MDSYQSRREEGQAPPGGSIPARGTGQLQTDSLQLSSSGRLRQPVRKASASLGVVDQMLHRYEEEVRTGQNLLGKLQPRMEVLSRALRVMTRPAEGVRAFSGVAPKEAEFTRRVIQLLQEKKLVLRQVQIAVFQFEQAQKGVQQAAEYLETAMLYEGAERATYFEHYCHIEKLRGQVYPMINLPLVFKDEPLLAQLFPEPKVHDEPILPPPPPRVEASVPPVRARGGISGALSQDPAVAQLMGGLRRLTGQLKEGLKGMTGKPPSES